MRKNISVDIYSDTICPWCYIGKRKLQFATDNFFDNNFNIIWRPYQLNPNIQLKGVNRKKYLSKKFGSKDNALAIYKNIENVGKKIGIFFQFKKITKTPNSSASHRLLALAHKKGMQNQILESIFYAYFIEGKDIGQISELIKIAKENKIDEKEALNYLKSSKDKNSLLQEALQAKKMGITGVPCFIINKEYVLFGAQDTEKFIDIFYNLTK